MIVGTAMIVRTAMIVQGSYIRSFWGKLFLDYTKDPTQKDRYMIFLAMITKDHDQKRSYNS